jgi:hypothetical protein
LPTSLSRPHHARRRSKADKYGPLAEAPNARSAAGTQRELRQREAVLSCLEPDQVKGRADPAAFGDLIAAVLALIALAAVVRRSRLARPLVALFNIEDHDRSAACDFRCHYLRRAAVHGARYWIPAFWVPALLVTHYVVFALLGKRWGGPM